MSALRRERFFMREMEASKSKKKIIKPSKLECEQFQGGKVCAGFESQFYRVFVVAILWTFMFLCFEVQIHCA